MSNRKGFTPLEIHRLGNDRIKFRTGFTLIELIMVVVILGVLAAMIVPRFTGRTEQAKISAAQADIEANLSLALDLYQLDNGSFPTTEQGLAALISPPTDTEDSTNWNGPYIKKRRIPQDPWGNPYVYISPGIHNPEDYDLYSYGPDGTEGGGDDITNWEEDNL